MRPRLSTSGRSSTKDVYCAMPSSYFPYQINLNMEQNVLRYEINRHKDMSAYRVEVVSHDIEQNEEDLVRGVRDANSSLILIEDTYLNLTQRKK